MNNVKLLVICIVSLQSLSICAAEEFKIDDDMHISPSIFEYLDDSFQFLQSQGIIDQSLQDFLSKDTTNRPMSESCAQDSGPHKIIDQAYSFISYNLKDRFFTTMNFIIENNEDADQVEDPIFLYVMENYKNSFMKSIMHEWIQEWETTFDKDGFPLLNWCLNQRKLAKMLVDLHANLNMKDKGGWTPLHYAACNNNLEIAQIYIGANADINIQNKIGVTPLHLAAWMNHAEIVHVLVQKGAQLNIKDRSGNTPLDTTEHRGIINILIIAGAHLSEQDNYNRAVGRLNYKQFVYAIIKKNKVRDNNQDNDLHCNSNNGRKSPSEVHRSVQRNNALCCVLS